MAIGLGDMTSGDWHSGGYCTGVSGCEGCNAKEEIERLRQWVSDLQKNIYITCVCCGHRYGPNNEVPASMADVLKDHIEKCPDHPMSELKRENERLHEIILKVASHVRAYQLSK